MPVEDCVDSSESVMLYFHSKAEFQSSLKESREPDGIGFPTEDILGPVNSGGA